MPTPCTTPLPGQILMYPMSTRFWTDAVACPGCYSNGNAISNAAGPEIAFGRELIRQGVSSKVGFIPTAVGGTSLAGSWMPPNGPQWQNMISTVQTGMKAAGPSAILRGLLWVQGETDGLNMMASAWYYPHFETFVNTMRAQFAQFTYNLPIISATMAASHRGLQFPFIGSVR